MIIDTVAKDKQVKQSSPQAQKTATKQAKNTEANNYRPQSILKKRIATKTDVKSNNAIPNEI